MPTDRAYGERAETYLRLLAEAALRGRAGSGDSASESGASESGASGDSASGPAEGASGPAEGQTAGQADVQRVYRAADLLVQAGILTDVQAAWILLDLTTALRARGHREPRPGRPRLARPAIFPKRPDARPGEWRVVPGPAPVPGAHVMALIVTPDRMLAPATLSAGIPDPRTTPWSGLTAADDAGTGYQTTVATSAWAGNSWTGTILIRPAPPPEIQWLKIFIPNGFSLLIPFPGRSALPGRPEPVPASPGELLLTRYAESFLAAAVQGFLAANPGGFTSVQPGLGELAGTLEAAGALPPLSPVPGQVARLHALLGLPAPDAPTNAGSAGNAGSPASTGSPTGTGWPTRTGSPADTDTSAGPGPSAGPGSPFGTDAPAGPGVPRRWLDVVSYYGRRRPLRPVSGTASIGVPTAAIDGVRFAVAGLHSDPNSTHLLVIARGLSPLPQRVPPGLEGDAGFSWWLRDDAGGWHLAVIDEAIPAAAEETVLRMALLPPLAFAATALIAEITGPSARVTITLPLRW